MPQQVLNILLSCLGVALSALIGWGVERLIAWLNTKIKDEKARNFVTKILTIVTGAVKQIYQEFVEVLKKEGKFNEAAQKEAKTKALEIIKTQMTPELEEYIKSNFGDVQSYLSTKVEEIIYNLKNNN